MTFPTAPSQQKIGDFGTKIVYEMPLKDGATFIGWHVNGEIVMFPDYPAQDTTYEAVFSASASVVSFNTMGGTFAPGVQDTFTGTSGESYVKPADPIRDGFAFGGWFTAPEGAGERLTAYVYPTAGNTVYYANWTAVDISVTLDANGGTIDENGTVTADGRVDATIRYTMPDRLGYAFMGWSDTQDAEAGYLFPTYTTARNGQTLYAVWRAGEVTVLYVPMGGSFADGETGVRTNTTGTPPARRSPSRKVPPMQGISSVAGTRIQATKPKPRR